MFKTLKKLFDNEYKELYRFSKLADQIDALDEEMSKLSDKKLASYTDKFKKRLEDGETLDDILVEAFAVAREAAYRCLGMKPFYCQLLGGLAIHYGNIAEMKTGEGKTLTCVLPAYLNALTGKGVHIVTVNEFLSTRDSEWMGSIFKFLGLTVGLNLRELSFKEKQVAYNCDILYSSNKDNLFDYLVDDGHGGKVKKDVSDVAVENLKKDGVDVLVILGGDGTLTSARDFSRKGVNKFHHEGF